MVKKIDVIYFFFNIWEIFMLIFKLLKQEYMLKQFAYIKIKDLLDFYQKKITYTIIKHICQNQHYIARKKHL